jgi:DNA-binding NarL/FixJ family response regulator
VTSEAVSIRANVPAAQAEPTRVFVVDDHELFRTGLCGLLEQHGLVVVGEAASAETACVEIPAAAADVVVMDLELPGISGVEATKRLARSAPRARVVAFTMAADDDSVTAAISAGARGYLLKDAPAEDIIAAVQAVAAGESPISPRAAGSLFERLRSDGANDRVDRPAAGGLTAREREVLELLVDGRSNTEIADALYISPPTVKHHISSILGKLGVGNRIQAAVQAVRERLI